jgi:hypothetical protein
MKFLKRSVLWYCAAIVWLISPLASATSAQELYQLPPPEACYTQLGVMGLLLKAREKGLSAADATIFVMRVRADLVVSKELSDNVFGHPGLDERPLERYTLWSCHARAHKVPVLPLDSVAADTQKCYASSAPFECALILQNRITGLPGDFKPRSSMVQVPTPVANKSRTTPPTK